MTYRGGQYNFSKAERITKKRKEKNSPPHSCFFRLLKVASSILCLPEPPPHHTPKLTATQVAGAVRGACKHTGTAVSHDQRFVFHDLPFSPSISDLHHVAGPPFGWMNPGSQPTLLLLLRFASNGEWDWSCSFIFYCLDSWVSFLVSSRV